jgi:hypothetical protein
MRTPIPRTGRLSLAKDDLAYYVADAHTLLNCKVMAVTMDHTGQVRITVRINRGGDLHRAQSYRANMVMRMPITRVWPRRAIDLRQFPLMVLPWNVITDRGDVVLEVMFDPATYNNASQMYRAW